MNSLKFEVNRWGRISPGLEVGCYQKHAIREPVNLPRYGGNVAEFLSVKGGRSILIKNDGISSLESGQLKLHCLRKLCFIWRNG